MAKKVRIYKPKDPETGQSMYSEALTDTVYDKDGKKLSQIIISHENAIRNKVEKKDFERLETKFEGKHQVMREDAYEALPEKKVDVIYMTYEE